MDGLDGMGHDGWLCQWMDAATGLSSSTLLNYKENKCSHSSGRKL